MIGNAIANFIVACIHLTASAVTGVLRFIITLIGPGLFVVLVVVAVALWWFGWIGPLWHTAASFFT